MNVMTPVTATTETESEKLGRFALGARQDLGRPLHVLATDQVKHLPGLRGRHTAVAVHRAGPRALVGLDAGHRRAPRSWPAW